MEAEQLWMGDATILRPSIIVGDSETGRCGSFGGWYILFQAVSLLDRLDEEQTEQIGSTYNSMFPRMEPAL